MIANYFKKPSYSKKILLVSCLIAILAVSTFKEIVVLNWFTPVLTSLLVLIILQVNRQNKLNFNPSFVFLFVVILIGYFPQFLNFEKNIFISNFLLILVLRKIYSIRLNLEVYSKVFDAGFWLGVAVLFQPLLIIFLIFLILTIIIYDLNRIKIYIFLFLGISIPIFLYLTYCFYFEFPFEFLNTSTLSLNFNLDYENINTALLFNLIFVLFFILLSIFIKTIKLFRRVDSNKTNWFLILLNFTFCFTVFFLSENENAMLYLLFPTSIILANGLDLVHKNKITDGVLILFLLNLLLPYLV